MNVVISQSMYFPWVGMFEQIRLADKYVYYDDVQFSHGGFINRVQIKTGQGSRWLTVPVNHKLGQSIENTTIDNSRNWKKAHFETLRQAYSKAAYKDDMLCLVDDVFSGSFSNIGELNRASLKRIVNYFDLQRSCEFIDIKNLNIKGSGSQRVLDVVKLLGGRSYITGHGAKNYLNHELFEERGVNVCYMNYLKLKYSQLHGEFTPYVSVLDLVANCGSEGLAVIKSNANTWRDFI